MATLTSRGRASRQSARARRGTRWRFAAVPACGAMAEEDPGAAVAGSGSESEEGVSGAGKSATGSPGGLHRCLRGSGRSPGRGGRSGGRRGLAGDVGSGTRPGGAVGAPESTWERARGRPRGRALPGRACDRVCRVAGGWRAAAPAAPGGDQRLVRTEAVSGGYGRPALRPRGSRSSRAVRGCTGRGAGGAVLGPCPRAPAPNPAGHPGDTRNLWGYFLSLSRRRKLAERSEASGQVSEFNVTCKGEAGSWAGLRGLGRRCPPRATARAGTAPSPGSATPVRRCWGKAGSVGAAAAHPSQIHAGQREEGAGQSEAEGSGGAASEQRGGQEGECREQRGSELSPQYPLPLPDAGIAFLCLSCSAPGGEGGCLRHHLEGRGEVAAGGPAEPARGAAGVPPAAGHRHGDPAGESNLGLEGGDWRSHSWGGSGALARVAPGSAGAGRCLPAVLGAVAEVRKAQPVADTPGRCPLSWEG